MNDLIAKFLIIIFLFWQQQLLAQETIKTAVRTPENFPLTGYPVVIANLENKKYKYYVITCENALHYISVINTDIDNDLAYLDYFLLKKLSVSTLRKEKVHLQPIENPKKLFNPLKEAHLEIINCIEKTYLTQDVGKNFETLRSELIETDNNFKVHNINFDCIYQAFHKYFIENETLIQTNNKYHLIVKQKNITSGKYFLLIIKIQETKDDFIEDYFILSKNCKIKDITVAANKKQNIAVIDKPKNKIINNIVEKFDFNGAQFGIGGVTEAIRLFVETFIAPRLLGEAMREKLNMNISRGGILCGPPGTGKTLFISVIKNIMEANSLKTHISKISGPEIFHSFVGESEKAVRNIFTTAKQQCRSEDEIAIILIDEIDAMLSKRGGGGSANSVSDKVVNQFLACLDGIDEKNSNLNNIIVFGTTNRLDIIDSAATRPGRLDTKITFKLPAEYQRKEIFEIQTDKLVAAGFLNADVDLNGLAIKTAGYTGAEIAAVVQQAQIAAIKKAQQLAPEDNHFYPHKINTLDYLDVDHSCFQWALNKVVPQFGQRNFMDITDQTFDYYHSSQAIKQLQNAIDAFNNNDKSILLIHINGGSGLGKSTLASLAVKRFASSCYYLPAKNFAPYNREQKKGVLLEALQTGEKFAEDNKFSVVLDDFDEVIEADPAALYNVALIAILKSYAKSSIKATHGKLFIIVVTSKTSDFLNHVFSPENCFNISNIEYLDEYLMED